MNNFQFVSPAQYAQPANQRRYISPKSTVPPIVSLTGVGQNEILAALPSQVLESLFEHLELATLSFGQELYGFGDPPEHVFFLTTAIVALLYVTEDGASTEIAVVGYEGVVGTSVFAGQHGKCSAIVQKAGFGYRLKSRYLNDAIKQSGALPQLLMRYTNALFAQMIQNAVGGRHSSIEQNLCRWLLDRLDRSDSNELKATQELISIMLGVRRESITTAARNLQEAGLIQNRRGSITVIDREGLEKQAGQYYKAAKSEYERLLGGFARQISLHDTVEGCSQHP
jgi:CRP-like cAMP-binding protein